jgi:DNA (cytosine-5)-methyltransferase 1
MQLVLSLFPGIGLLDMAFEEEGFCVVRGPDLLWGGDVKRFHPLPGKFDGVIGGPPCQAFSQLRFMVEHNGHQTAENLIPEFERCVREAMPIWFLMENVAAAPHPEVDGYRVMGHTLKDHWVGGQTSRWRRFSFGAAKTTDISPVLRIETLALHRTDPLPAVVCDAREVPVAIGGSDYRKATASGGRTSSLNRGGPMPHDKGRALSLDEMAARQGVPVPMIDRLREHGAFTASALKRGVGNGVPLAMGRAVARAVKHAVASAEGRKSDISEINGLQSSGATLGARRLVGTSLKAHQE